MENLWGVLLGALIAAVAGLVGLGISRKNEHDQWRRNQKLVIYGNLLAALQTMLHEASEMHDGGVRPTSVTEGSKSAREVDTQMSRFRLIAPDSLRGAAEHARTKVFQLISHIETDNFDAAGNAAAVALAEFHEAATNDLHSKKTRHI